MLGRCDAEVLPRELLVLAANNFARRSSVEFAIQLKHDGRMVGLIGLDHINVQDSVAELWYMIVPTCLGKGYATEAARTAVWFGFER